MVRILLLLEDFNELLFTETILKKVGFDVESSKNHLNLVETLLGFNPEVLVVPGNGRRIHLADVLQQVRKQRRQPQIFVIGNSDLVAGDGSVAKVLTHPLNPKELLGALAEYGGMDAESLLEKYKRAQAEAKDIAHMQASASIEAEFFKPKSNSADSNVEISGKDASDKKALKIQLQPTTLTEEQRSALFSKALAEAKTPSVATFSKERIKKEKKTLRINEHQNEESVKLENERKEFLKTLAEATPASSKKN